jgi:hypothetical protein
MAITRENVIKEIEKLINDLQVKGGKGSARFIYGLIEGFSVMATLAKKNLKTMRPSCSRYTKSYNLHLII